MAQLSEKSSDGGFNTPIGIFAFNRPQFIERLLGILAEIQPRRILAVADGPRPHVAGDAEKCAAVRGLFEKIDWKCEIKRNFAEQNMGSFPRNSSGLNWVFTEVEEAIILEDDCMPDTSFFPYCEELLAKYRNDHRVGVISGNNFLRHMSRKQVPSYFFSRYALTWGWATWRRTWQKVDLDMPYWPEFRDSGKLRQSVFSEREEWYWRYIYDRIYERQLKNAWDYQLMLTCRRFDLLTAIPSVNLVSNIGHGRDATHCTGIYNQEANVSTYALKFPLTHPKNVEASSLLDCRIFFRRFQEYWWVKWSRRVRTILQRLKVVC
jgi:hypothetical protein